MLLYVFGSEKQMLDLFTLGDVSIYGIMVCTKDQRCYVNYTISKCQVSEFTISFHESMLSQFQICIFTISSSCIHDSQYQVRQRIIDFNFMNSPVQLHEFTSPASRIHYFKVQVQLYEVSTHFSTRSMLKISFIICINLKLKP